MRLPTKVEMKLVARCLTVVAGAVALVAAAGWQGILVLLVSVFVGWLVARIMCWAWQ